MIGKVVSTNTVAGETAIRINLHRLIHVAGEPDTLSEIPHGHIEVNNIVDVGLPALDLGAVIELGIDELGFTATVLYEGEPQ